jgi:hypothetical protein
MGKERSKVNPDRHSVPESCFSADNTMAQRKSLKLRKHGVSESGPNPETC